MVFYSSNVILKIFEKLNLKNKLFASHNHQNEHRETFGTQYCVMNLFKFQIID